jgi:hypothetical protein
MPDAESFHFAPGDGLQIPGAESDMHVAPLVEAFEQRFHSWQEDQAACFGLRRLVVESKLHHRCL